MTTHTPITEEQEAQWNYLVYRLLTRLQEEQPEWRSVTSTQFSKLPCIADRYLEDELDRDIEFPRYWYRYGEVGNREPLDNSLFILDEADWGGLEVRPAKPETPFEIEEETRRDIDEAIEFVVSNFANKKVEEIKKLQYKYFAPNQFIQSFEELRKQVYALAENADSNESPFEDESEKQKLLDLLEELLREYPADLYTTMKPEFLKWTQIMYTLLEKGDIRHAESQLEEFWEVFSKVHLRMLHNNHSIESQLGRWESENEVELQKYRVSLEDTYEDLQRKEIASNVPEGVNESFAEAFRELKAESR